MLEPCKLINSNEFYVALSAPTELTRRGHRRTRNKSAAEITSFTTMARTMTMWMMMTSNAITRAILKIDHDK